MKVITVLSVFAASTVVAGLAIADGVDTLRAALAKDTGAACQIDAQSPTPADGQAQASCPPTDGCPAPCDKVTPPAAQSSEPAGSQVPGGAAAPTAPGTLAKAGTPVPAAGGPCTGCQ